MRRRQFVLAVLAALGVALPALGQVGHPVKGSWIGYWGPSDDERRRLVLVLDWVTHDWNRHSITGLINPGPNSVPVDTADIDYATWTVTFEADLPLPSGGGTQRYVATGKLENLGSWTNRRFSGRYRFGEEEGTFALVLN